MGKSFKGFSKALSLILAVAMVVTCVPTSAYAAELLAGESEDILISNDSLIEESSDALVNDASASEEKSSSLIDTQKEADLAAAPEENTAGEEVNPDQYTGDATLTYYSIGTNVGVFTFNGNTVASQTGTTVYDSDDNETIYVVPKIGYKLVTTPVTYSGGYTEKGATAVAIADINDAYTESTVGMTDAKVKAAASALYSAGYDPTSVTKIVFNSSSNLAKAFAANKDGSKEYDTVPSEVITVKSAVANTIQVDLYKAGATTATKIGDATIGTTFGGASTEGINIKAAASDWTNVTIKGGIFAGFDEEGEAEFKIEGTQINYSTSLADTITALNGDSDNAKFYLDTTAGTGTYKLWVNAKGISDAYTAILADKVKNGSATSDLTLAFVLTDNTVEEEVHGFDKTSEAAASNYYALSGKVFDTKKVTESTTGEVWVKAELKTTAGARTIDKVYYKVGDADAVAATKAATGDFTSINSSEGTSLASGEEAASGYWKIAKSAITDDTVVYAETRETIKFKGIELVGSNSPVTVTLEEVEGNGAGDLSGTITGGSTYTNNITGSYTRELDNIKSIMISLGYHDNKNDAEWIVNNRELIANTIANSITEYYAK